MTFSPTNQFTWYPPPTPIFRKLASELWTIYHRYGETEIFSVKEAFHGNGYGKHTILALLDLAQEKDQVSTVSEWIDEELAFYPGQVRTTSVVSSGVMTITKNKQRLREELKISIGDDWTAQGQ